MRFLASAHASVEELFVLKEIVEGMVGADGLKSVTVTWTSSHKPQPANNKFPIPVVDAPNVNGARDLGFDVGDGQTPNLAPLQQAVAAGKVRVLYVVSPGPDGSLGDTSWIVEARRAGTLPALVVQGVVTNELVKAADIVLPGAAFVEKDALFTNDQGRVQASSRAIAPPGEAREDWQILAGVAAALGLALSYQSSGELRGAIAAAMPNGPYAAAETIAFSRPVSARHWLQASNPSERWKWDFMYQDLPPVKGHNVQMEGLQNLIPLKPVG